MPKNDWPFPRWVAHRGAGRLAPENTLAAFRFGAMHGFRMFECDVKLSRDEVPFLLHDSTLQRTTNGHGVAGQQDWSSLSQLDAGSWHSRAYAGEPLCTLEAVGRFCVRNGYWLNIEIKPTPGTERHTGEVVAAHAARIWKGSGTSPFLTSFAPEALQGAQAVAPQLPRGLLLDSWDADAIESATSLGCAALVCNHAIWTSNTVAMARSAALKTLSYTVNDEWAARRLQDLGTDAIITDRVDLFAAAD